MYCHVREMRENRGLFMSNVPNKNDDLLKIAKFPDRERFTFMEAARFLGTNWNGIDRLVRTKRLTSFKLELNGTRVRRMVTRQSLIRYIRNLVRREMLRKGTGGYYYRRFILGLTDYED